MQNATLTTIDCCSDFSPHVTGEWNGAARLARAICMAGGNDFREPSDDLRSAAREFAIETRRVGQTPEQLVVGLKSVFEHLDHHIPSLADPMMLEHNAGEGPLYAEWYASVLRVCIETYFEMERG